MISSIQITQADPISAFPLAVGTKSSVPIPEPHGPGPPCHGSGHCAELLSGTAGSDRGQLGLGRVSKCYPSPQGCHLPPHSTLHQRDQGVTRVTMGLYGLAGHRRAMLPACQCDPQPGFCSNGVNAASFSFWNKSPPKPEPSRAIVAGNHGNGRLARDSVCLHSCP